MSAKNLHLRHVSDVPNERIHQRSHVTKRHAIQGLCDDEE